VPVWSCMGYRLRPSRRRRCACRTWSLARCWS
jgi:hypothetical protein